MRGIMRGRIPALLGMPFRQQLELALEAPDCGLKQSGTQPSAQVTGDEDPAVCEMGTLT